MTNSIKSKLIEKTKAQVRMISDMKLAQHILSDNRDLLFLVKIVYYIIT